MINENFPPSVPYPGQNYSEEVKLLLERVKSVTDERAYNEIKFFDDKGILGGALFSTLLFGSAVPVEELIWVGFGIGASIYDAGVAVWREKLANSRVRPPTVLA